MQPPNLDLRSEGWKIRENATPVELLELGARVRRYLHTVPESITDPMPNNVRAQRTDGLPPATTTHQDVTQGKRVTKRWQAAVAMSDSKFFRSNYSILNRTMSMLLVVLIYLLVGITLCSVTSIAPNLRWQGATCYNTVFSSLQARNSMIEHANRLTSFFQPADAPVLEYQSGHETQQTVADAEEYFEVDYTFLNGTVNAFKTVHTSINDLALLTLDLLPSAGSLVEASRILEDMAFMVERWELSPDLENKNDISAAGADLAFETYEAALCALTLMKSSMRQTEFVRAQTQSIQAARNNSILRWFPNPTATTASRIVIALTNHLKALYDNLAVLEQKATACQSLTDGVLWSLDRVATTLEQGRQIVHARHNAWKFWQSDNIKDKLKVWKFFTQGPGSDYDLVQKKILLVLSNNTYYNHIAQPRETSLVSTNDIATRCETIRDAVWEMLGMLGSSYAIPFTDAITADILKDIESGASQTLATMSTRLEELRRNETDRTERKGTGPSDAAEEDFSTQVMERYLRMEY